MFKTVVRPVARPVIKKPFILDTFNPDDVLFSFSIARALSSFSSPLQIRRGSDSAVLNVGYPGGVIDEQAIKNFGQATASDCFVASYQNVSDEQPKIYDVSTGDVTKENGKPAMVFDGLNDNIEIPNVAGRSNIDAYFVNRHDDTSTTSNHNSRYAYLTSNVSFKVGYLPTKDATNTVFHSNYGNPSLYKNNTLLSPVNRNQLYVLLGQTQNIINHQGANVSTWLECNFGAFQSAARNFEGTLQEIIIFKRVLSSDERNRLHDDIMDFYKISN